MHFSPEQQNIFIRNLSLQNCPPTAAGRQMRQSRCRSYMHSERWSPWPHTSKRYAMIAYDPRQHKGTSPSAPSAQKDGTFQNLRSMIKKQNKNISVRMWVCCLNVNTPTCTHPPGFFYTKIIQKNFLRGSSTEPQKAFANSKGAAVTEFKGNIAFKAIYMQIYKRVAQRRRSWRGITARSST